MRGRSAHGAHGREADHGVIGGEDDVGEQHQVGTAGETVAVHLADYRLMHVEDRHPRALRLLHAPGVVVEADAASVDLVVGLLRIAGRSGQVVAGGESAPGPAEDHDMDGGVVVGLPHRGGEFVLQGDGEGVEFLGPVEGDVGLAVAHLVEDVFEVGHGSLR